MLCCGLERRRNASLFFVFASVPVVDFIFHIIIILCVSCLTRSQCSSSSSQRLSRGVSAEEEGGTGGVHIASEYVFLCWGSPMFVE